jgi:uncharacterized protein (TIGR02284 family)
MAHNRRTLPRNSKFRRENIMAESINNEEVIKVLKNVINSLEDGQKGFTDLAEHLQDPHLKQFFVAEALKRASFRGDLESELHHAGVHDVKETGTVAGALHRTWGNVKLSVVKGDHEVLSIAEQGEDVAKKAYADALEQPLPLPIKQLLITQQEHVIASHNHVRDHRDALALAAK